jgi:hypothetical protein
MDTWGENTISLIKKKKNLIPKDHDSRAAKQSLTKKVPPFFPKYITINNTTATPQFLLSDFPSLSLSNKISQL